MNRKYLLKKVCDFKRKYPFTVAWRLKKNTKIAYDFISENEDVIYAFAAQKNDNPIDFFGTAVIVITDKRIIVARKRVLWGYSLLTVTPEMYNDLTIKMGLIWGRIYLDTINEMIVLSNIQRKALPEIENSITSYISEKKHGHLTNRE